MPVAPSFTDLLAQGQAEAQSRRPDLTFGDGDIVLAMLHAGGAMADAIIRFCAQAFRATYLDGAEGDELTALVDDHLNIQRSPATAAQVTLSFARISGGAGGTIAAGSQVSTDFDASGKRVTFTTDTDIIVADADNGPFGVSATAAVAGSDGNVAAASIIKTVTTLFDTFTVTNPAAAGGGNDAEADEDLRTRARAFFTTLRRGTLAALEFGAMTVASVRTAVATENLSTGDVTITVSDADGNSTAQMIEDVTTELENWRCAGVNVTVTGGTKLVVDLAMTLTVRKGFDVTAVNDLLVAAPTARMNKLRSGDPMTLDEIKAAVISVSPDDITKVTFTSVVVNGTPAAIDDVTTTSTQVVRPGTLTVT